MSNSSFKDYDARYGGSARGLSSDDEAERRRAENERKRRLEARRVEIDEGRTAKPVARDTRQVYDRSAIKKKITAPPASAKRLHIVLIDNSGSNKEIAAHLRNTSGYLLSILSVIDPESAIAWDYFSDHGDGPGLMQEIDYVTPDEAGDKIMHSTLRHVTPAGGGDFPEAIECALWSACEIDFGSVPKDQRFLYLVTDSVAHGMGMSGDNQCPDQRSWESSVERVGETFGRFTLVGCTDDKKVAKLQAKFLDPARLEYDLIDLSAIKSLEHRMAITGNALLFLIARQRGLQTVGMFLMTLYEKWLSEPIFGQETDLNAREGVRRFLKYIEADKAEIAKLEDRIIG